MAELNELFTGAPVKKSPARPTRKADTQRAESDILREARKREEDAAYAHKKEANCGGVLESVERACKGNKYLEAMILGDILNSPKFKNCIKK